MRRNMMQFNGPPGFGNYQYQFQNQGPMMPGMNNHQSNSNHSWSYQTSYGGNSGRPGGVSGPPNMSNPFPTQVVNRPSPAARSVPQPQNGARMDMQTRFIQEALQAHNRYRARHGCRPLAISQELNNIAKNYAHNLASRRSMDHSSCQFRGGRMGENLAMAYDSSKNYYSGEQASKQWYDEIQYYNFQAGGYNSSTGHFTQLVWKSTTHVGFGVARASDGSFYAVANYYPAGNCAGQFGANVPRPQ